MLIYEITKKLCEILHRVAYVDNLAAEDNKVMITTSEGQTFELVVNEVENKKPAHK